MLATQTNPELWQFGMGIANGAKFSVRVYRAAALLQDMLEDARGRWRRGVVQTVSAGSRPAPGLS